MPKFGVILVNASLKSAFVFTKIIFIVFHSLLPLATSVRRFGFVESVLVVVLIGLSSELLMTKRSAIRL